MSDPQDPINERINFLVNHYEKGVRRRFSLKIGVSPGMISDLFSERKNKPGIDMVRKILVAYPQISTEWLLLGEGDMLKKEPVDESAAEGQESSSYMSPQDLPTAGEAGIADVLARTSDVGEEGIPSYGVAPSAKRKAGDKDKPASKPAELAGLDLLQQVAANTADIKKLFGLVANLSPSQPKSVPQPPPSSN